MCNGKPGFKKYPNKSGYLEYGLGGGLPIFLVSKSQSSKANCALGGQPREPKPLDFVGSAPKPWVFLYEKPRLLPENPGFRLKAPGF